MLGGWCARVLDVLCPFFRGSSRRGGNGTASRSASGGGGGGGGHDVSLNMILHGECGVGKTSLRNRWVDGVFTGDVAPTFGVDFNIKTLVLVHEEEDGDEGEEKAEEIRRTEGEGSREGEAAGSAEEHQNNKRGPPCSELQVKINVYDTSGKPGYREVNSTYLLAFDAVLFVYDISAMSSLDELRRHFSDPEHREKLAARKKSGTAMLLVGNKCDLPLSQRQVGSQTGQDAAAEFGMSFLEVSAKRGTNVREAFMSVATRAVGEHIARAHLGSGRGRITVRRTMQRVPGLQSVLRARAGVVGLFTGMTTRRKYVQKKSSNASLLGTENASPHTTALQNQQSGEAPYRDDTDLAKRVTGADQQPLRPPDPLPKGGANPRGSSTSRAKFQGHRSTSFPPPSSSVGMRPPRSPGGWEDDDPTARLIRNREASPTGSNSSRQSTKSTSPPPLAPEARHRDQRRSPTAARSPTITERRRPPTLALGIESAGAPPPTAAALSPLAVHAATAETVPTRNIFPGRGRIDGSGMHRNVQAGSRLPVSPPAPISPREQLNPGNLNAEVGWRSASKNTRGGAADWGASRVGGSAATGAARAVSTLPASGNSGRGSASVSPERDGGTGTDDSAARRLKEASSFWLDKWGIKAAKTDATRGRRVRMRNSPPPSPKNRTNTPPRYGRPANP